MQLQYFESILPFNELQIGVEKYKTSKNDYCIIELHSSTVIICTKSQTLINRFSINPKFTEIQLTRDELSFRMADQPLKRSTGNPNLLPLI